MKRIDNDGIYAEMRELKSFFGTVKTKYLRNLRLFEYSSTLSLQNLSDDEVVGYYQQGRFNTEDDLTSAIQENVIRSVIETLVSKIASQKVRPFFNTRNGTFKEMQVVKQAQQFFDVLYAEQNVNETVSMAFRDATIFDKGIIFIDRDAVKIQRVMPWQVYYNPREYSYKHLTRIAFERNDYPTSLLPFPVENNLKTVTFWEYWDLNRRKHYAYIPELNHWEEESYDADVLPFLFIHYSNPIKGSSAESIVDLLYGIQMEVDFLNTQIKDASQRALGLKYLVPEDANIRVTSLTNRAGEIITYRPLPNQTTPPVVTAADPFMDPQWIQLLDKYKQDAYEMVGISQLSAMSQKPKGLDSGVALSTMEDIESDRFETQLNTVIRSYVDLAKLCIALFPADEDILPQSKWRGNITWADIVEARDLMSIQFSAAEFLSDDPQTKTQQIQALVQGGYISQARAAMLLEIPDMQTGYSLSNNAINAVMSVIDRCLEYGDMNVPQFIPAQILMEEIANTQLSLYAGNYEENKDDIEKLNMLMQTVVSMQQNVLTDAEISASTQLANQVQQQYANAMQPGGQYDQMVMQANIANGLTPDGQSMVNSNSLEEGEDDVE